MIESMLQETEKTTSASRLFRSRLMTSKFIMVSVRISEMKKDILIMTTLYKPTDNEMDNDQTIITQTFIKSF